MSVRDTSKDFRMTLQLTYNKHDTFEYNKIKECIDKRKQKWSQMMDFGNGMGKGLL